MMYGWLQLIFLLSCLMCVQNVAALNCPKSDECLISSSKGPIRCSTQKTKCSNIDDSLAPGPVAEQSGVIVQVTKPNNSRYSKISMEFSWQPSTNALQTFKAFEVEVYKRGIFEAQLTIVLKKFYCFPDGQNLHDLFPFTVTDCYGNRTNEVIEAGDDFEIYVISYPLQKKSHKLSSIHFDMEKSIPPCTSSFYNGHAPTRDCSIDLYLLGYFCENSTYHFGYHVPNLNNKTIQAELLIHKDEDFIESKFVSSKYHEFYYKLPNKFLLTAELEVDKMPRSRLVYIKHKDCKIPTEPVPEQIKWYFIAVPVLVLALIVFLILFKLCIYPRHFEGSGKKFCSNTKSLRSNISSVETGMNGSTVICNPWNITVYIVFTDDHPKHKDVILKFASFLQCDLGFRVLLELWEQDIIYKDSLTWMENALNQADKIIVIWSPGAKKRWETKDQNDIDQTDLFCPVVRKIKGDLLMKRNIGRYFFTFFDYCSDADIPVVFHDLSFCNFQLMKQFEQLYFRLKNLEKFQSSAVVLQNKVATDSYFTTELNKLGKILSDAVAEMTNFVQSNPDWYKHTEKQPEILMTEPVGSVNDALLVNSIKLPSLPSIEPNAVETLESNSKSVEKQVVGSMNLDDSILMPLEISVVSNDYSFATENFPPSRQPTEHTENNLVLDVAQQKTVSNNNVDSGLGSVNTNQDPSFHVTAFSFPQSEVVIHEGPCYTPACIEPLDMKNDPWSSLAQINNANI